MFQLLTQGKVRDPNNWKLSYFDIKGLAEPIRFLMKYGGIEFIDDRFDFDRWEERKSSAPFGQVPVLYLNGKEYNQTVAICRYVAKKVGLAGNNDLENLEIDGIVDTIADFRDKLTLWYYEPNAEIKESKRDALFRSTIPFYMQRFNKIVLKNAGHLACKRLTWADLFFVSLIDLFNFYTKTDTILAYKNLQTIQKTVLAIPKIWTWVSERPNSEF